jgi:hypothetical protein
MVDLPGHMANIGRAVSEDQWLNQPTAASFGYVGLG